MVDLGTAVGYLELDTSKLQGGFKDALTSFKSFGDQTSSLDTRLKGLGSGMTKVGGLLTAGVTTPLLGAGAASVKFASDMQGAFAKFQGKVGTLTGDMEQYKQVMDDIYKNNYGDSWDDVAESMGLVVQQLGEMDPSNLQSTTESAIALRDAFGYEVGESIRTVDTLMKNFGLTSQEAFDYIVKGQQQGLDFSGEFLDTLNEYSVQFQKLGFDVNDMFTILQRGADAGAFNLDKVGDAIKEFSIRVVDGSDTTAEGFAAIGLSADEMAAKFAQGGDAASQAFDQTIQALISMEDPLAQNAAGVALFGTMWEDLGPSVILQLGGITDATYNAKGAMDSLKDVQYGDFESALAGLGRTLQSIGAQIGEVLLPYLSNFIGFLQGMADRFAALDPSIQTFIVGIGLLVAAIGPLMLIGGQLVTAFTAFQPVIAAIGTLLSGLSIPIAAIIAGIAALALAWNTNFAGIRDATMSIMTSIQTIIQTIWGGIVAAWNSNFLNIQTIAQTVWSIITTIFQTAFTVISNIFAIFAAAFQGDWGRVWELVKSTASTIWDAIKSLFQAFLNLLVSILTGIGSALLSAAKAVFNKVKEGFTTVWDTIKSWFSSAIKVIPEIIKNIGTTLFNTGKGIFTSLWNGLKSVWDAVSGWVQDKVNWLIDKVAFWRSESSKMDTGGSYASGLDYVPRDMVVKVHEGESIWTKQQTNDLINAMSTLNAGNASGDLTVVIPVNGTEFCRAIIKDFRRVSRATPEIM